MANSAYWFKHDTNAKDDHKIMLLMDQLGLEGYGIFWVLIEVLREQDGYSYPLSMLPILSKRYGSSAEKFKTVVLNYGLFEVFEGDNFFSPSLCDRMGIYDKYCEQRRLAGSKGGKQKQAHAKHMLSTCVAQVKHDSSEWSGVECKGSIEDKSSLPTTPAKPLSKAFESSPFKDQAYKFADWFDVECRADSIQYSDKVRDNWAWVWYALMELDKRTNKEEIKSAIKWARADKFWSTNFYTPLKLRERNGDGVMYLDVFIEKYRKAKPAITHEQKDLSELTEDEFWKIYWPYRDALNCSSLNGLKPARADAERDLKFYLSKKAAGNGRY